MYPGAVDIGITDRLLSTSKGIFYFLALSAKFMILPILLIRFFTIPIDRVGERGLYSATLPRYPSLRSIEDPEALKGLAVFPSTLPNSSSLCLVDGKGETKDNNEKALESYRRYGVDSKVWEHTLEVFSVTSKG